MNNPSFFLYIYNMKQNRTNEDSLSKLAESYEQMIVDEATTLITYIGFAEKGIATSAAKWIIFRVQSAAASSPTGIITIKYAGDYKSDNNIWDNRASLTYNS